MPTWLLTNSYRRRSLRKSTEVSSAFAQALLLFQHLSAQVAGDKIGKASGTRGAPSFFDHAR